MDAVQLIRQDHEKVKNLFFDFEMAPAGQPEQRRHLAEQIIRELMVHERIEEEIFYPAFRDAMGKRAQGDVEHALEEHHLVDTLIAQLTAIDLNDPDFEGLMRVLRENVEHHIQDEEESMLTKARDVMGDDVARVGADMLEYKQTLLRELEAQKSEQRTNPQGRTRQP